MTNSRVALSTAGGNSSTLTLTVPEGAVAGDLLVAVVMSLGPTPTSAPDGWTLQQSRTSPYANVLTYTRVSTGALDSHVWYFSAVIPTSGMIVAYRGPTQYRAVSTGAGTISGGGSYSHSVAGGTPSSAADLEVIVSAAGAASSVSVQPGITSSHTPAFAPFVTTSSGTSNLIGSASDRGLADTLPTGTATVQAGASTSSDGSAASVRFFLTQNVPPNAPTPVAPIGGSINKDAPVRFSWEVSDPDVGDSQSAADLRFRLLGAVSWTDRRSAGPYPFSYTTAGFFAAGDYEWQVRTYDALGLVGPYSPSAFFKAVSPPPGPVITDPVSGGTIPTASYLVKWSTPEQDAYQLRTVADAAGVPDETAVYVDTGTVEGPGAATARSASVAFPLQPRVEHVQLRTRLAGLWSPWSSNGVLVSYTRPATPTVTMLPVKTNSVPGSFTDAQQLTYAQPAPTGDQPQVSSVRVFRRLTAVGGVGIPLATDLPTSGAWLDRTAANGVPYDYLVVAVGTNGTVSTSGWNGVPDESLAELTSYSETYPDSY